MDQRFGLVVEVGHTEGRRVIVWSHDDGSANVIRIHALESIAEALMEGDESACEKLWISNGTFGGFDKPRNQAGAFSKRFVNLIDDLGTFRAGTSSGEDISGMTRAKKMSTIGNRLQECCRGWKADGIK